MSVTKEEIHYAASKLFMETGKPPTNQQIRDYLGKGSMSTITPVLREWKATHKSSLHTTPLPSHIKKVIETSLEELWSTCVREASQELEAYREASLSKLSELEASKEKLTKQVASQEQTIESLRGELERIKDQYRESEVDLKVSQKEQSLLREELKSVRASRATLEKKLISLLEKPQSKPTTTKRRKS